MHPMLRRRPIETIIYIVRGQKVIFDFDLAILYGLPAKRLKERVRRNIRRFPTDFLIELTAEEAHDLRTQIASSRSNWGGRRYRPFAFTEQGVAMLSSVLGSDQAIEVNIEIMRAFVRLREIMSAHTELDAKLKELESRLEGHDEQITAIFEAIRSLMTTSKTGGKRIGF
jgi:hypothetical protein